MVFRARLFSDAQPTVATVAAMVVTGEVTAVMEAMVAARIPPKYGQVCDLTRIVVSTRHILQGHHTTTVVDTEDTVLTYRPIAVILRFQIDITRTSSNHTMTKMTTCLAKTVMIAK